MGTSNSAAMGCSQPKEFRTGLRIVGSFLKVKLYYNICGTQVLLRLPDRRGLSSDDDEPRITSNGQKCHLIPKCQSAKPEECRFRDPVQHQLDSVYIG